MNLLVNYGIKASQGGLKIIEATGGTVTDYSISGVIYRVHAFTTIGNSSFVVNKLGKDNFNLVNVLVVGGGGGGSQTGGGGGGVVIHQNRPIGIGTYNVTVGAGGLGRTSSVEQTSGFNSYFDNIVAFGGGAGSATNNTPGGIGGSGGGAGRDRGGPGLGIQTNTGGGIGYGNNGGNASQTGWGGGGGGGGAGAVGGNGGGTGSSSQEVPGTGGDGIYFGNVFTNNYGENGYFAGGAGMDTQSNGAVSLGGLGGAGDGGGDAARQAMPNTGGGGGGKAGPAGTVSGNGGSGIVLVGYPIDNYDFSTGVSPVLPVGITKYRYWRYVRGTTIIGHHPNVARIDLTGDGTTRLVTFASDNSSDIGQWNHNIFPPSPGYIDLGAGNERLFTGAQIYSVYGNETNTSYRRSANVTVQGSNDLSNWITTFTGVAANYVYPNSTVSQAGSIFPLQQ